MLRNRVFSAGWGRVRLRALFAGIAALIIGLFAAVPMTDGPAASIAKAHHWPASCGREGQKPCPVFGINSHVPSCMPGLVERPFGKRCSKKPEPIRIVPKPESVSGCGAEGEQPCVVTRAFPSCEGALVEHFGRNRCVRSKGDIVNMAKNTLREVGPVLRTIGGSIIACGIDAIMAADNLSSEQKVSRIQSLPCWSGVLRAARNEGYQTLTLGGAGSAAFLIGAEGENGFAFDTAAKRPVTTYHTLSLKFGSVGAGAAVTVGLFKKDNRSFGGDAHGAAVGFTALGGGGAGVFFDYGNAKLQGAVAVITSGAEFDLAYIRSTTEILPTVFTVKQRQPSPTFVNIYDGTRVEIGQKGNYLFASGGNTAEWYRSPGTWDRRQFRRCSGAEGDFTFSPPSGLCQLSGSERYVPFGDHLMLLIRDSGSRVVLTRSGIRTYGWSGAPLEAVYKRPGGGRAGMFQHNFVTGGKFNEVLYHRTYYPGDADWTDWRQYILVSASSQEGYRFDSYRYESETDGDAIILARDNSRVTFKPGAGSSRSEFYVVPME